MIDIEELKTVLSYIVEDGGLEPKLISEEAENILDELKVIEKAGKLNFKNLKPVLDKVEELKDYLYGMGEDTYAEMIGDAILDITIDASFDESGKGYDRFAEDVSDTGDSELDEFLEVEFNNWYDNQELEDNQVEFNLKLAYKAGSKLAGYYKFDKGAYEDTEEYFREKGLEPDLCNMFKAGYIDHYVPERI